MTASRIAELASNIQASVANLEAHFKSCGLPLPSFDVANPLTLPLPPEIKSARTAVLEGTDELHSLIKGPVEIVTDRALGGSASLQAISRFNIASSFPVGETATFGQVAAKCGLGETETRRLLRNAMTFHIFEEQKPGIVAHTAASRALLEVPRLAKWVELVLDDMWPSQTRIVDAMTKWRGSHEPNNAGFNLAHNEPAPFYKILSQDPRRRERLKQAMAFFHASPGLEPYHVVDLFEWHAYDGATMVDVGGSDGSFCIELARKLPKLQFIIQDLPEVIAEVDKNVLEDVSEQIKFMAHNFLEVQPVKNADIYFFRWVLHDWSHEYCLQILRNLIPALKPGARILINELCIPEPGQMSCYQARWIRFLDESMMAMQNAMERDAEQWAALFQEADSRFKMTRIRTAPDSKLALIEVVWEVQ